KEVNPPVGQDPIHWRLLTTHRVVSLEQALQVIEWYRWRWRIEQLFGTLKRSGLDLESTQLESVSAIERLTVLALSVALRVLQLLEGRDDSSLVAQVVFSPEEQECLRQLAPTLQGKTQKQQNPHASASLSWATWLIGRLGGWSGYRSQSPPGIRTLWRGLYQFESIFHGWKLAQSTLVCTQ
ncbi:MAG: IS4-like element ISSysp3 family transposase, partial [Synechococcus sp.]|nr:IS4-like element ISSysp3 family transposase [Synechococcus sp.]